MSRFPLSTLEEAIVLTKALAVAGDSARVIPLEERGTPMPCDACATRTSRLARFGIYGDELKERLHKERGIPLDELNDLKHIRVTGEPPEGPLPPSFFCAECVDSAKQYGLIEGDLLSDSDHGATVAFGGRPPVEATPPAGRRGQRSPLANYAEAYRILVESARPLLERKRTLLGRLGVHVPIPESDKLTQQRTWEALKADEEGATILTNALMSTAIGDAVPFLLPDGIADLLSLTDASDFDQDAHLPFPKIWLDGKFRFEERTYFGILAAETHEGGPPIPVSKGDAERGGARQITLATVYEDAHGTKGLIGIENVLSKNRKHLRLDFYTKVSKSELRDIGGVLQNWLNLLDSPQIETESRELSRRDQDMHQRATGTKAPSRIVHVRILDRELLRAVDKFRAGRARYSHAFWVRGHWRTLHAARYKENVGRRLWIAPYVKGDGILVEKAYQVDEPPEEDQS